MSDVVKRALGAYLLLLRGIAFVAVAIILFISAASLIVLPLWYVSTHFATLYSVIVPVLVLGALSMLGVRGLQRRARERRTIGSHQPRKTARLRLGTATGAALLSVYFGAASVFGGGLPAFIPALLAACVAGILAAGLRPFSWLALRTGTKDRER